jgi:Ser/Thr protein kinase RdoA (MazF antagonist)
MHVLKTLLERHWPLDRAVPGTDLQRSTTRNVISIRSEQGPFVVKVYEDAWALGLVRPSPAEIDQRLGIFDYLARIGVRQAPSILKTIAGDRFVRMGGMIVCVLERIEGTPPPPTPDTWADLGRVAARLNARTDYPHDYAIPVPGAIAELTAQAARYPFKQEFLHLVSTLDVLQTQPRGLIHGELNLANSIRSPTGRLSVLDWDQAGTGPWALEPGYPLITTFLSEDLKFDARSAAAFYSAWAGHRGIDAGRRDVIFTAALLHALRYLGFGNPHRRWARIRYALAHKQEMLSALDAGAG